MSLDSALADTLFSFSPPCLVLFDIELRCLRVNAAAATLSGRADEALEGLTPAEVLPGFGPSLERLVGDVLATGVPRRSLPLDRPAGGRPGASSRFLVSCVPVRDGNELVGGLVSLMEEAGTTQAGDPYRVVVDAAREGVWLLDPASRTTFANPRMAEMLGYTPDEMACTCLADILVGGEEAATEFTERRRSGVGGQEELELACRDGTTIWALVDTNSLLSTDGSYAGAAAMVIDITARHAAEEEREALYRSAFFGAPSGMLLIDLSAPQGAIIQANPAFCRITGYRPEQLVGRSPLAITHPDDRERDGLAMQQFRAGSRERYETEKRYLHAAGHVVWAHIAVSAVGGRPGPPRYTIAHVNDVTARRRAEAELRESEERFRRSFDDAPIGMTISRLDGRHLRVNRAMCKMTGYDEGELLALSFADITHPDDREGAEVMTAALLAGNVQTIAFETRFVHKNGHDVWAHFSATLMHDSQGKAAYFIAQVEDITERHSAELALRDARDEAERANRAKSEFLSRMSHELRTPLNSILGFGQVLQMAPLDGVQQRHTDHIVRAGKHLLALIDDVLDIARIEAGDVSLRLAPVSLDGVVADAVELLAPMAREHRVRVGSRLRQGLVVHADGHRLGQVVLNLLSNAIKYNHPDGTVTITAAAASGGVARLDVTDTGRGLPPEASERAFAPFDRLGAEESGIEGTGLGLAISKRLIEAMGGSIRIASELSAGTTVTIELPRAALGSTEAEADAEAEPGSFARGTARVLYVEDNLANLQLVESILQTRDGIEVIPALSGRLGVDLARQHEPDLVLLDLHLPDIDGEAVLGELRGDPRTAALPVVVISADADTALRDRLLAAGARAYLTKPLDVPSFLREVEAALG